MARLILKSSFININKHAGNLIKYVGTRDGVELNNLKEQTETEKQILLIKKITDEFEFLKESKSYEKYLLARDRITASEFLTESFEALETQIMDKEIYMKYIAQRPNVEKFEEHGLFNQNGFSDLNKELYNIKNHKGTVWTSIISLKREDTELTGYDNAELFQKLIASKSRDIADAMGIKFNNFIWNGAFHNEGNHPHVHLIYYSKNPEEGFLNKEGIDNMKRILTREIFKGSFLQIESDKDKYRTSIREEFKWIAKTEYSNLDTKNKLEILQGLKSDKRNYYKYQDKKVKDILKQEVKRILSENSGLIDRFTEFKECEKKISSFYSEKNLEVIDDVLLQDHTEFKSVFLNAILKEVTDNKDKLLIEYREVSSKKESMSNRNFVDSDLNSLESLESMELFENNIKENTEENIKRDNLDNKNVEQKNNKELISKVKVDTERLEAEADILKIDKVFEDDVYIKNLLDDLSNNIELREYSLDRCTWTTKSNIENLSNEIIKNKLEDSIYKNIYSIAYLKNQILAKAFDLKYEKLIEYKSNIEDTILLGVRKSNDDIKNYCDVGIKIKNQMEYKEKSLKKLLQRLEDKMSENQNDNNLYNGKGLRQKIILNMIQDDINTAKREIINLRIAENKNRLSKKDIQILDLLKSKNVKEASKIILEQYLKDQEIKSSLEEGFNKYNSLFKEEYKNILEDEVLHKSLLRNINKNLYNIKFQNEKYQYRLRTNNFKDLVAEIFNYNNSSFSDEILKKDIDKIIKQITDLNFKSYYSQSSEVKEEVARVTDKIIGDKYRNIAPISSSLKEIYLICKSEVGSDKQIYDNKLFKNSFSTELFKEIIKIKEANIKNEIDRIEILNTDIINKLISKDFKLSDELSSDLFELSKLLKSNRLNIYEFQSEKTKEATNSILEKVLNSKYQVLGSSAAKDINSIYKNYLNENISKLNNDKTFKNMLCNKVLVSATTIKKEFYTYEKSKARLEQMDEINKKHIKNNSKNLCLNIADDLFKMTKEEKEGEFLIKGLNKKLESQAKAKKKKISNSMEF